MRRRHPLPGVLALSFLDAPSLDGTLGPFPFRDAARVDVLAGAEHVVHDVFAAVLDRLEGEIDAIVDGAAADARFSITSGFFFGIEGSSPVPCG